MWKAENATILCTIYRSIRTVGLSQCSPGMIEKNRFYRDSKGANKGKTNMRIFQGSTCFSLANQNAVFQPWDAGVPWLFLRHTQNSSQTHREEEDYTNRFSASSLSILFQRRFTSASCSCSKVFSRSIFSRLN